MDMVLMSDKELKEVKEIAVPVKDPVSGRISDFGANVVGYMRHNTESIEVGHPTPPPLVSRFPELPQEDARAPRDVDECPIDECARSIPMDGHLTGSGRCRPRSSSFD